MDALTLMNLWPTELVAPDALRFAGIAVFAGTAVLAAIALARSDEGAMLARAWLQWRLGGSRFGLLMRRRHVDVATYVQFVPLAQFKQQLAVCARCPSTERCQRALGSLGAGTSPYSFCPNRSVVEPFFDSAGIQVG